MQQPKQDPSNNFYEKKIAELESKLNRANKQIKRLRLENTDLQKQVGLLQEQKKPQSSSLMRDFSLIRLEKPSPKRRRRRSKSSDRQSSGSAIRLRSSRRQATRMYQLRLAAIALAAVAVSFILGSSLVRLIYRSFAKPSAQASAAIVKELPITPLLPPEFPIVTKVAFLPKLPPETEEHLSLVYNVTAPPELKPSEKLQAIVDELVQTAQQRRLPLEPLSITLINVKTGEIAGYQQQQPKYPASVIKMFWMVCVYDMLHRGLFQDESLFSADLYRMIQQSSNDAASRLIDAITGTVSGDNLQGDRYQEWLKRRERLSEFFQKAGYEGIAVNQKTYPINYLRHKQPEGRDLQMWEDPKELRNQITSEQAARLMYEIVTKKAVSPEASDKMVHLLARDLRPEAWRENTAKFGGFHPIKGFLGQYLPSDVDFASKAGWTETGRHEVAFIRSRDDGPVYILAVLGADEIYSKDWQAFPTLSRLVFDRMSGKTLEQFPNSER